MSKRQHYSTKTGKMETCSAKTPESCTYSGTPHFDEGDPAGAEYARQRNKENNSLLANDEVKGDSFEDKQERRRIKAIENIEKNHSGKKQRELLYIQESDRFKSLVFEGEDDLLDELNNGNLEVDLYEVTDIDEDYDGEILTALGDVKLNGVAFPDDNGEYTGDKLYAEYNAHFDFDYDTEYDGPMNLEIKDVNINEVKHAYVLHPDGSKTDYNNGTYGSSLEYYFTERENPPIFINEA